MPNSALPANTYMGDGQRTTSEMRTSLDQVATWLNAAQAELDALTGTTFGEAAVREVGSGAGNVPDTAVLDTRLATTGNLGDIAVKAADDYAEKTAQGEIVFSGSTTSVGQGSMGSPGAGMYFVRYDNSQGATTTPVYWDGVRKTTTVGSFVKTSENDEYTFEVVISDTGAITVNRWYFYNIVSGTPDLIKDLATITEIRRL